MIVIGDRVLIKPDNSEEQTKVGLYLPQSVIEKQPVNSGVIVEIGPGIPIPNFQPDNGEAWQQEKHSPVRYLPTQADVGDYALYQKKDAIEIRYQNQHYVVVPHSALLMVIREDLS